MPRFIWFCMGAGAGIVTSAALATALLVFDALQLTVAVRNLTNEPVRAEIWLSEHLQSTIEIAPLKTESVSFSTSDASLRVKVLTSGRTLEYEFGYVTHSPPQDLYMVQITDHVGIEGMKVQKLLGRLLLGEP